MPTFVDRIPISISSASTGGVVVFPSASIPPATEVALFEDTALRGWWRADVNFGTTWLDRKNDTPATLVRGVLPSIVTGLANRSFARWPGSQLEASVFQTPADEGLWPVNAPYSFAFVVKPSVNIGGTVSGAIGSLVSDGRNDASVTSSENTGMSLIGWSSASSGQLQVWHQTRVAGVATTAILSSAANSIGGTSQGNTVLVIVSFAPSPASMQIGRNTTQLNSTNTIPRQVTADRLHFGGGIPASTAIGDLGGARLLRNCEVAEILAYNVAIMEAANSSKLTALRAYVLARYPGIWTV